MRKITIDLSKEKNAEKVLHGRVKGKFTRGLFNLNDLDESDVLVDVVISDCVFSLTSSFFNGMFGCSLRKLGSKFKEKYRFTGPDVVDEVNRYIVNELNRLTYPLS